MMRRATEVHSSLSQKIHSLVAVNELLRPGFHVHCYLALAVFLR
jgi:hypothetical protein